MRHRFTEPAGGTVQAEPEVYPRARSHRLYSVVSGVWRAMNGARRHAGGVGAVPLVLGPLCHVNGGAGDCRGPVIRIACGIVGRPVFRSGDLRKLRALIQALPLFACCLCVLEQTRITRVRRAPMFSTLDESTRANRRARSHPIGAEILRFV